MTSSESARTTTHRIPRILVAGLLAVVAVISAGCSSAPAETGGSGGDNAAANRQQAVKFAQCMRDNGVRGVPDPDASGQPTIDGIATDSTLHPHSPALKQA